MEKARKVQKSLSGEEDEEESELTISQEEKLIWLTLLPVEKIKKIYLTLRVKGQSGLFFPDLNGFIRWVNLLKRKMSFQSRYTDSKSWAPRPRVL